MKVLKYLLIAILLIAIALLAIGYFSPTTVRVEQSKLIDEPQEKIYYYVGDLRTWSEWDPWSSKDPNMEVEFGGKPRNEGMRRKWKSDNKQVGSGIMRINQATPFDTLKFGLNFMEQGLANTALYFDEVESGVQVTWTMEFEVDDNIFMKLLGRFMEFSIKRDYKKGLNNLAAYLKEQPNPYPSDDDFVVMEVPFPHQQLLFTSLNDVKQEEFTAKTNKALEKLQFAADTMSLEVVGQPLIQWNSNTNDDLLYLDYYLPVDGLSDESMEYDERSKILTNTLDSSLLALKHTYTGGLYGLQESIDSLRLFINRKQLSVWSYPYTQTTPTGPATDTSNWMTDIYFVRDLTVQ